MLCTSYKYCSVIANDCGAEVLTGEVGREQREELMGFPVGYTASINYETVPPQSWPASPTFLLIPPSYDTFGCRVLSAIYFESLIGKKPRLFWERGADISKHVVYNLAALCVRGPA